MGEKIKKAIEGLSYNYIPSMVLFNPD